jgi:hypothetical protein
MISTDDFSGHSEGIVHAWKGYAQGIGRDALRKAAALQTTKAI